MKRILILVDNLQTGGAGRVASILANEMVKEYEVHVVVKEGGIRYKIEKNVHYHILSYKKIGKLNVILRIFSYARVLNMIKPQVIYSFGYMSKYTTFSLLLANKCKAKVIASERSDPNSVPKSNLMKKVRDFCYERADYLVCQTIQAKEYFINKLTTRIEVISNPITPNLPQWKGIDSLDIVAACRLDKQKNLPMLINAFEMFYKKHKMYNLYIYGDGPLKEELKSLIEKKGLSSKIFLPGATSQIHKIFSEAFMFVSSSNHEGMSNSMLEALAIGVPSVCTDCPVGAPKMFIKNKENGMLVPIDNANEFYLAMDYIASNKDKLKQMSINSMKIREELAPTFIASKWIQIINKL